MADANLLSRLRRYIKDSHGGYRGYVLHLHASTLDLVGWWRRYHNVDWRKVKRLVFVCQGNICRSPYAEAKARKLGLEAVSFGIRSHGYPAEPMAKRIAAERGIDLEQHHASQFEGELVRAGDLLIGLEPRHVKSIAHLGDGDSVQVTLLGIWSRPKRPIIVDPYQLSVACYRHCYTLIDSALDQIVDLRTSL